ncbi:hypothetical protein ACOQFV_09065 [Nocardiopsis changdeensis]|uniref:Tail terminator n=1 Tax=Nocardiopsis changdeensis TaxID=2831969 RepID=A0ABX8BHI6_9ACTN|nr:MULTISPECIES: hypothetical protein [Nocardiopsis]QUX20308.1 hypothetical protein KGD84_17415 [Nocardiopsis changdeensis]QYX36238.1 hypothetical protein K1J57_26870 [Nocardiopsis sp. MT53]
MALPVILYPDAELVVTTWLRGRLGAHVGHVCTDLPVPDRFPALLPIVQVNRLPSPPADRRVHDIARMQVVVRVAESTGRPGLNSLAGLVGAHFAVLGGSQVTIPATDHTPAGPATVGCVRRQTNPSAYPDTNTNLLAASFTGELYLRPFRV